MSLENDISCLYAAKNFAEYIQLGQPEQPSAFLTKLSEIIEKYGKDVWNKIKGHERVLQALEEGTEEQEGQTQSIIHGFCTEKYEQLETEITREYEQRRAERTLTPEDKEAYHQFMVELSPGYMFMLGSSVAQQEAQENLPEREQAVRKEMDEWRQQEDKKHDDYLASAGINTPEGKTAWTVAHHAAYHFSQRIYFKDEYDRKLPADRLNFSKEETTIKQEDLEVHVGQGIDTGLMCAQERAIITNEAAFRVTAAEWLSKEINDRLSKGLEFNLLDAVSVKKCSDGLVYLKIDQRKPYQ